MRVDEWLIPAGEPRELTPAEVEAALAEDPELVLISDYLARGLTAEQTAEVERRLEEDAAFRTRAEPIIAAWNAWPTVAEVSIPKEEMAASWQRFLAKAAWRDSSSRDSSSRSGAPATDGVHAGDPAALRRLRRWQLAAGLLLLVGVPLSIGGSYWMATRRAAPRVHLEEASAREMKMVRLEGAGWVTLDPGARLTWEEGAGKDGTRTLYLDGSGRFRLEHVASGQYVVTTPSARIVVTGTEFDVSADDPSTTRVRVESGVVMLTSRGARAGRMLELRAGERGEATWNEIPRSVR